MYLLAVGMRFVMARIFERTNERTVLIQEQSPYKRKDGDRWTDRDRRRDRQSDNIYKQFNTVTTTTNMPNTSYTTLGFTSSKLTTNKFCEEHKLTRKTHCALCITVSKEGNPVPSRALVMLSYFLYPKKIFNTCIVT